MRNRLQAQILGVFLLQFLVGVPFYLGIYKQNVALFDTETKTCYVTDTMVSSLPDADQKMLQDGVPLTSIQAAAAAMEDLCS